MKNSIFTYSLKAFGYLFILTSLLFTACEDELYSPTVATIPVLKTDAPTVVLNQKQFNQNALSFSWTSGSNYGTNSAIDYYLQVDKGDNNFENVLSIELGRGIYTKAFKTTELNDLIKEDLNLPVGQPSELAFRIKSVPTNSNLEPDYSNEITVTVTPYEPVTTALFLVGSAAPTGWDAGNATPMVRSSADPTVFIYSGNLFAGELKFLTVLGEWIPSYGKGLNDKLFYRTSFDEPDDKFEIEKPGNYKITVDLVELTFKLEELAGPPYSKLWIVGDATPNGWNIDNPNEMKQDPNDLFVFTYNEILKAGEFKIPTSTGNWGTDFYMPLENYQDLNSTAVTLIPGGSPDNKWRIVDPGAYKITLNLRNETISIKKFTPYDQLWMVGDATPNGWNINNPNQMTKDQNNPFVFTYQGPLSAGEFKIPTATGDWGTDYFMPATNHQDLTLTDAKFIVGGNPDNKWKIETPGNYKITLNQLYETVVIEKL
jgi:starch-binding outer membrane protein SusE/F